jgi:hypothetical protein
MPFPSSLRLVRSAAFKAGVFSLLVAPLAVAMSAGGSAQEGILGGLQNPGWTGDSAKAAPGPGRQIKRPKNMPLFLDPAIHPAIGLEGNHYVTMDGIAGFRGMYATIRKGGKIGGSKLHSFYEWTRDPKAEWVLHNFAAVQGSPRIGGQFDSLASAYYRGKLKVFPNGRMTFVEPIGGGLPRPKRTGVGCGYYKFQVYPAARDFSRLRGRWQDAKKNRGGMQWRRLVPKIRTVSIAGVRSSGGNLYKNQQRDARRYSDIPPTLTLPLSLKKDFHAKANSSMRGNRPGFILNIFGDEMWGQHYVWIDPASDIEITHLGAKPISYVAKDGRIRTVGSKVYMNLWQEVKEGPHTLYFDGQPIVFNVKKAWTKDNADPQVDLDRIDVVDIAGKPLTALGEGQAFQIRAVFKAAHPLSMV